MKTASRIAIAVGAACVLLAIWQPVGAWWQWALTALVLLLAGAGTSGNAVAARQTTSSDEPRNEPADPTPEQIDADVAEYKRRVYGRSADR